MHSLLRICFILFIFLLPCTSAFTDEQSLLDFRNSITLDPLNALANWISTIHFCNWTGVTCDSAKNRVQILQLPDLELEGSISPSIGNLSFLIQLNLINNSFVGQIPQEIGRIQGLQNLYLSINLLEGSIPRNLTSCKELKELILSSNLLTGTIPSELDLLTNLRVLKLGSNNLCGNIPPSLGNLSYLETLSMEDLDLEGHIPPELGMLSSLTSFIMFGNSGLTGPIPLSISNNSGLVELALYSNSLTGTIPLELGKLSRLKILYLWDNQLRGTIPATIANCTQLIRLDLELNHLNGEVPLELSKLSLLKSLSLSSNQLVSGSSVTIPILTALRNCTVLSSLMIHDNYLTGYLPEQLPTNLSVLRLDGNSITGNIPFTIANITNLGDLNLSSNLLIGRIPSSLKSLGKLQRLLLDNNKLEGNIPSEIGEIESLGMLSVSHNMLSGKIPDTIGRLQQLTHLVLNNNHLSGNVTASLGNCYSLELLDLSSNQFKGSIPHEVASLANLQFYFNLSRNAFQGSLPLEIGKMIHVQAIDVSANRLEGTNPGTLGSCEQLEYLKLSSNELQGTIPNSLSGLKSLVSMDLSSNNLSGLIPVSLNSLNMLQYLNLSFNNFSGEIPEEGIFKNLTSTSFMGNMGLCGKWMQLPACPVNTIQPKDHISRIRIFALGGGTIAFLLVCLLLFGLIYRRNKVKCSVHTDILSRKLMDNWEISYQEILEATDGFNERNLLGTGSFGSVYKGIMGDGTEAAFKLINLQNEEYNNSFIRECKVLANVRHRNLVKIISFCSEFRRKLLVLEFMSKGNLETMLHSNGNLLTFLEILNIAIDVIHGLEYLHHDSFIQVVHCDIKPSNILMDEDMTAHVADFGIARMICESDTSTINSGSISTLSLKGSMGYIAPEYGVGGKVSTRGDVYSYGIMLLEMVTRKSPIDNMFVGGLNLHSSVSMHFDNKLEEIIDMRMMEGIGKYEINQTLIPFILIALECSKECPSERPAARKVVGRMQTIRETHHKAQRYKADTY
ncbi:hypothetical protein SUGI_1130130 [Cryptomeria japonica]|uniref:putative receptor-like protein kinase At3g47110 n=1 Tax=Cryptomeria japonica TaxID=3369 RepID=UPI002414CBB0|nr:putative receptor-like protein kinase At3g47110 [Cryptomeria japonica]GLJ53050.1 hypothetical protein SUGI_1130130 [Cryptomeria japonica]